MGGILNEIYTTLSKIIFLIVGLRFLYARYKFNQGLLLNTLMLYGCYAISTIIAEDGNFRRLIMQLYPILGMMLLTLMECRTYEKLIRFVGCISRLFFALIFVNFVFLPFSESWFGGSYFLGIENQIGYALLIGFLFVALDKKLNGKRALFTIYLILYFATVLYIFSGSNVTGAIVIALYMFIPFANKFINRRSIKFFLIGYGVSFIAIVLFPTVLLNWEPIKYFIVDVLGKNITLTNRTAIWTVALDKIKERPIWGYGVRDSVNQFYIHLDFTYRASVDGTYSAHNQFLQTLYEGGMITVITILGCILKCDKKLKTCLKNSEIIGWIKMVLIVCLIMMLAEAPGWDALLLTLNMGIVLCDVMKEKADV